MAIVFDSDRNIIPRWRDFATTAKMGELSALKSESSGPAPSRDVFERRIRDWAVNASMTSASEILGAAMLYGTSQPVLDAAEFVLKHPNATSASRSLAARLLGSEEPGGALTNRQRIQQSRVLLYNDPRNSIAWVNAALCYARLGQLEKGVQAMSNALRLSPDNRFVLRSAVRLYCHLDNPDRAHELLVKSARVFHDPWLMAAEIATASVMKTTGSLVKYGRMKMLARTFSDHETAELASAIAMVELENGNSRASRKLIKQSLVDPTENAVAQARWASRDVNLQLDESQLSTPGSFEARAWSHFYRDAWSEALGEAREWQDDEAFSRKPAILGSFVASVGLEDYEQSLEIVQTGLLANPRDPTLMNNKIFSLANLGRLDEAETELNLIPHTMLQSDRIALTATAGLLCYRRGEVDDGRKLYLRAIEEAFAANLPVFRARAAVFLACEDLRANTATVEQAFELATAAANGVTDNVVSLMMERLTERRKAHETVA